MNKVMTSLETHLVHCHTRDERSSVSADDEVQQGARLMLTADVRRLMNVLDEVVPRQNVLHLWINTAVVSARNVKVPAHDKCFVR